ncbi:MAG: antitoxin VapB family protein [Candidatus Diapherotrites archaeon]|uniref:Antitoxin VapB family protein n=1 Tax=Candidatus Iainarchaeum sp. TaxID=3101447 RepID=A0A8T3YNU2_9ARCH|nr:antitoxin VapB family protein [Candidatus Diapherotrites archaeon]
MTRVISISDEAYERLRKRKNGGSFSEAIMELTGGNKKKSLYEYLKERGPNHELADAFEKAYKERGKYKFKDVTL